MHLLISLVRVEPIQETLLEDEDEVEILSDWPEAPVTSPPPPVEEDARPLIELGEGVTAEHPKGVYFFRVHSLHIKIKHDFAQFL